MSSDVIVDHYVDTISVKVKGYLLGFAALSISISCFPISSSECCVMFSIPDCDYIRQNNLATVKMSGVCI